MRRPCFAGTAFRTGPISILLARELLSRLCLLWPLPRQMTRESLRQYGARSSDRVRWLVTYPVGIAGISRVTSPWRDTGSTSRHSQRNQTCGVLDLRGAVLSLAVSSV